MKCTSCHAILLPVEGEMFCLQCGKVYVVQGTSDGETPKREETSDPVLRKAINDVVGHPVQYRLPVAAAPPKVRPANLAPLRELVAPSRATLAMAGGVSMGLSGTAAVPASAPSPLVSPRPSDQRPAVRGGPSPGSPRVLSSLDGWLRRLPALSSVWYWWIAIAVFGVFVMANVVVGQYFTDRVYPGVRIGSVLVGGKSSESVKSLVADLGRGDVQVRINGRVTTLPIAEVASPDAAAAADAAMKAGRNTSLPLVGVVSAWWSAPITVGYDIDQTKLASWVRARALEVDRPSHDAALLASGTQILRIREHTGEELDQTVLIQDIRQALADRHEVTARVRTLTPLVLFGALEEQAMAAQAAIDAVVQIKLKTQTVRVPAETIAGWLRFSGTHGVQLDAGSVTDYVAGLPGSFDRAGTVTALLEAVPKGQAVLYEPSTKSSRATAVPVVPRAPIVFHYCVAAADQKLKAQLSVEAARTLTATPGWGLHGQVQFVAQEHGCNVTFVLLNAASLRALNELCKDQATCRVGAQAAIDVDRWQAKTDTWKGTLAAYRSELINQGIGQWLGFDHPGCLPDSVKPTLTTQRLDIGTGCSAVWYVNNRADDETSVLPGFAG